ncbi:hypothetical protein ACFLSK_00580 [Chloroflexota bacterium]
MESQSKEEEYMNSIWVIYRKEWERASSEKRRELNKRMNRWQELMKSGMSVNQAYTQVMGQGSDESPVYMAIEEKTDYGVREEPSSKRLAIASGPQMRKAPLVFLSLALAVAIIYGFIITGERNALNEKLEIINNTLSLTEAQLLQIEGDLSDTKQSLAVTEGDLSDTKQSLASTQSDLSSAQSQLLLTEETLASTRAELDSTSQTLTLKQNELDDALSNILLYQETFGADVFSDMQPQVTGGGSVGSPTINNNPIATNPTWTELKAFLRSDQTDNRQYSLDSFNCVSFAEMLHNNAEDAGIKSAFVSLRFEDEPIGHALNAFKTADKGLTYVDCGGGTASDILLYGDDIERDKIAYVKKGQRYGMLSMNRAVSPEYSYYKKHYDVAEEALGYSWVPQGVIESIQIYW